MQLSDDTVYFAYDDFSVYIQLSDKNFINDKDVITRVYDDLLYSAPLKTILETYGCPDLILQKEVDYHFTGNYTFVTAFVYYQIGIDYYYYKTTVQLSDIPDMFLCYQPTSLDGYVEDAPGAGIKLIRVADWSDVISPIP